MLPVRHLALAHRVFDIELAALKKVRRQLDGAFEGAVDAICETLHERGKVVVVGIGGFVEVAPNRPPFEGWCQITTGTFREIERVSVDPTRRTLFATDAIDGDGSEPRALVLRATLPQ